MRADVVNTLARVMGVGRHQHSNLPDERSSSGWFHHVQAGVVRTAFLVSSATVIVRAGLPFGCYGVV